MKTKIIISLILIMYGSGISSCRTFSLADDVKEGFLLGSTAAGIVQISLASGQIKVLIPPGSGSAAALIEWWGSPLFDVQTSTLYYIDQIQPAIISWRSGDTAPKHVCALPTTGHVDTMIINPEGTQLLFFGVSTPGQSKELLACDIQSGEVKTLTTVPLRYHNPIWLDHRHLAFGLRLPETFSVEEFDLSTYTRRHLLTVAPSFINTWESTVHTKTGIQTETRRSYLSLADISADKKKLLVAIAHEKYLLYDVESGTLIASYDETDLPGDDTRGDVCFVGNDYLAVDRMSRRWAHPRVLGTYLLNVRTGHTTKVSEHTVQQMQYLPQNPHWDEQIVLTYQENQRQAVATQRQVARQAPGVFAQQIIDTYSYHGNSPAAKNLLGPPDEVYYSIESFPQIPEYDYVVIEMAQPIQNAPGPDVQIHGKPGRKYEDKWHRECGIYLEGSLTSDGPWVNLGEVFMGEQVELPEELQECRYFKITCCVDDHKENVSTPAVRLDAIQALHY